MERPPKTPQLKKLESYKNDRVEGGEYPQADRHNRPAVKALGRRQVRHNANQFLAVNPEAELQPSATELPKKVWRNVSRKLPEHIESTRWRRNMHRAHNILDKGYTADRHARFRRVLSAWLAEGDSEHTRALAEFYQGIHYGFAEESGEESFGISLEWAPRRTFLYRFFETEPELKAQFEGWIAPKQAA